MYAMVRLATMSCTLCVDQRKNFCSGYKEHFYELFDGSLPFLEGLYSCTHLACTMTPPSPDLMCAPCVVSCSQCHNTLLKGLTDVVC